MVMCMAFIKLAFNNIGYGIKVYDHYTGNSHNHHMFGMIDDLFNRIKYSERYRIDINYRKSMIRVRYATSEELK